VLLLLLQQQQQQLGMSRCMHLAPHVPYNTPLSGASTFFGIAGARLACARGLCGSTSAPTAPGVHPTSPVWVAASKIQHLSLHMRGAHVWRPGRKGAQSLTDVLVSWAGSPCQGCGWVGCTQGRRGVPPGWCALAY
jgi:hypothetical protein